MDNKLSKQLNKLARSHLFFISGRVFFEIFMNIYIWKLTSNLKLIAFFNISYLLTHVIVFSIFAPMVKRGRINFPRKLGLVLAVFVYLGVYFLRENAINYLVPIGIFMGVANGLYWISYQVIRFDLTNKFNRGNYTGLESAVSRFSKLTMPIVGGFVITANFFNLGYANIFLIGMGLFLLSFLNLNVGIQLKQVNHSSKMNLRKTLREVLSNKDIFKSMLAYSFAGLGRTGSLIRVLIPLLVFSAVQNEFELGTWLSFFTLIAILVSIFFGRKIDYKYYKVSMITGCVFFLGSILFLVKFPDLFITYVIFGIVIKIIDLFISIPKRVISENLVHEIKDYQDHRIEYIIIREWFSITGGRVLSYVLIIFASGLLINQLYYILLIMSIGILIESALLNSINIKFLKN